MARNEESASQISCRVRSGNAVACWLETRAMHVVVLGRNGAGASSFLWYLSQQDIEADRGFLYFDLYGDAAPVSQEITEVLISGKSKGMLSRESLETAKR